MPTAVSHTQIRDARSNFVWGNVGDVLDTSMIWLVVSCCGNPDSPHLMPEMANMPQASKVFGLSLAGDQGMSCRELPTSPPCPNSPPQASAVGNWPCRYLMALHMGCERKLLARWFCSWTVEKGTQIWMEGAIVWRWNCVFQPPAQCFKTLLLPFLVNMKKKRHAIQIRMHTERRIMQFLQSNLKMN